LIFVYQEMSYFLFLDGQFLLEEKASIPITDRGLHFGDGVFVSLLLRDSLLELWESHLSHFYNDCRDMHLTPAPIINKETIKTLVELNKAQIGKWRVKIMASGRKNTEFRLADSPCAHLIITCKPVANSEDKEWKMGVYPEPLCIPFRSFKTLAHLTGLLVMQHAHEQNFDDCVCLSNNEIILETSFANLFWIQGKKVQYPSNDLHYYFGAALKSFLRACEEVLGLELQPGHYQIKDIPSDASVFRCNSFEFGPVISIAQSNFARNLTLEQQLVSAYKQVLLKNSTNVF